MAILYHHIDSSSSDDHHVTQEPDLVSAGAFRYGVRVDVDVPDPLVFEVDYPSKESVPHFVGETTPVFSDQLVKTFRSAGVENFQLFPAVLRNPATGAEWDGFWVFHAIGLIAAADLERSESDTIMKGARKGGPSVPLVGFQVLVLDQSKTRNAMMFRLAESPDILLIHDRVLEHIKAHRPPNGWGFDATEIDAG